MPTASLVAERSAMPHRKKRSRIEISSGVFREKGSRACRTTTPKGRSMLGLEAKEGSRMAKVKHMAEQIIGSPLYCSERDGPSITSEWTGSSVERS